MNHRRFGVGAAAGIVDVEPGGAPLPGSTELALDRAAATGCSLGGSDVLVQLVARTQSQTIVAEYVDGVRPAQGMTCEPGIAPYRPR